MSSKYPVKEGQTAAREDGLDESIMPAGQRRDEPLPQRPPPPPQQQQQRFTAPMQPGYQYQYPYRYPSVSNVVYTGKNSPNNSVGYYMGDQDSSQSFLKQGSGINVMYPNVLPTVYNAGNVFPANHQAAQQPGFYPYGSRTPQLPVYQYYPVYPGVGGSPSRDGAPPQPVHMDGLAANGVLPSLQVQQPLMPQSAGKHPLPAPFHATQPQTVIAPSNDPRLAYHQSPFAPQPGTLGGWGNDSSDNNQLGHRNRPQDINPNDEEVERKSVKKSLDQGYVHKCHLCNKSFKRRSWLKRHLLSHSPDRHFACPWCLSKHKRKDNLLQHMKLKHTDYVLQELRSHNIKVDGGFLTISNNDNNDNNNSSSNIRSLLYEGKLNKDEVKKVLNSLIDKHNTAHN